MPRSKSEEEMANESDEQLYCVGFVPLLRRERLRTQLAREQGASAVEPARNAFAPTPLMLEALTVLVASHSTANHHVRRAHCSRRWN